MDLGCQWRHLPRTPRRLRPATTTATPTAAHATASAATPTTEPTATPAVTPTADAAWRRNGYEASAEWLFGHARSALTDDSMTLSMIQQLARTGSNAEPLAVTTRLGRTSRHVQRQRNLSGAILFHHSDFSPTIWVIELVTQAFRVALYRRSCFRRHLLAPLLQLSSAESR